MIFLFGMTHKYNNNIQHLLVVYNLWKRLTGECEWVNGEEKLQRRGWQRWGYMLTCTVDHSDIL